MRNFQVVSQNLININRKRTKKELSDFKERERTRKKRKEEEEEIKEREKDWRNKVFKVRFMF
jgi:hypothetical protein